MTFNIFKKLFWLSALALLALQPFVSLDQAWADVLPPSVENPTPLTSADLAINPFFKLNQLNLKYNLAFPVASDGIINISEITAPEETLTLGQKTYLLDLWRATIIYQTSQTDALGKFALEKTPAGFVILQKIGESWSVKNNLEIQPNQPVILTKAKIITDTMSFPADMALEKLTFTNFDLKIKQAPISPLKITTNWLLEGAEANLDFTFADGPSDGRYVFYQPFKISLESQQLFGKLGVATVGELSLALPDIDDFKKPILYRWDKGMKKFTPQNTSYVFNGHKLVGLKANISFWDEQIFAVVSKAKSELIGEASWYKVFGCLCAASRHFPRGSRLRVTAVDPIKGKAKSVVVRVNDYGPEAWTERVIDLDSYAFKKIGSIGRGVMPVIVELVDPKTPLSVDDKAEKERLTTTGTIYIPFKMTPAMLSKR